MKIGIIKEHKVPADTRVALTPVQCTALMNRFPEVKIYVESSPDRCFSDEEYIAAGIEVVQDISVADVLLGIKEIPPAYLIANKTYFFFSHTIKKQPANREILKDIISKKIKLIDYETLRWENGQRVLGFGRFAGIVGSYNGLRTWGIKSKKFELKSAWQCEDYRELLQEAGKVDIGNIRMVLTGGGRVANGALDFLRNLRIREITPYQFLHRQYDEPVFVHLNSPEIYRHREGMIWNTEYFYSHHKEFESSFSDFLPVTDLLINGVFWTADLPALFKKEDTGKPEFKIRVIADISCDVDGSVPITYKATSIQDPVIGWDRKTQQTCLPFTENSIDVMAVSNLPNELPCDASEEFGENLLHYVFPEFLKPESRMILEATITGNGELMPHYQYLEDYIST
ncbi:MAG: alanine dehydrogenase [Bacteroidetes bacterium]|nr:alanine dehydrogenase [Bacteroidota bacterium]